MPGWYFAHAQDDLNLRLLHMFEGTFSADDAHLSLQNKLGICYSLIES